MAVSVCGPEAPALLGIVSREACWCVHLWCRTSWIWSALTRGGIVRGQVRVHDAPQRMGLAVLSTTRSCTTANRSR